MNMVSFPYLILKFSPLIKRAKILFLSIKYLFMKSVVIPFSFPSPFPLLFFNIFFVPSQAIWNGSYKGGIIGK